MASKNQETIVLIGNGMVGHRLMPRQIDNAGSNLLVRKIEDLGVHVHLGKSTQKVNGNGRVTGMDFADGDALDVDMIIVSAGIRPWLGTPALRSANGVASASTTICKLRTCQFMRSAKLPCTTG